MSLQLEEKEESREGVDWEEDFEFCFVGCFLTAITINFQSMKTVFANLCHPLSGVTIANIKEKRYLFRFYCEVDKTRIVKGSPWTFNNHLFVFAELSNGMNLLEVP